VHDTVCIRGVGCYSEYHTSRGWKTGAVLALVVLGRLLRPVLNECVMLVFPVVLGRLLRPAAGPR
jgi:hypothetical protein